MNPNPFLKKLGLSETDRAVIFYADDIGMCHASVAAYADMVDFGLLSSASVMVPCPWFPPTAAYCRVNQADKPHLDMGVHLTLTSEWTDYRWGPISTRDADSGLLDSEGFFPHTTPDVQERAKAEFVQAEIAMQLARAIDVGIDVTHIDSHMGSLFHPKFLPSYLQLALTHNVPAFALRQSKERLIERGLSPEMADAFAQQVQMLEEQGYPLFDSISIMPIRQLEDRLEYITSLIDQIPPGLTYFIVHPSKDTPELRAITQDWQGRVGDYELFTSKAFRQVVEASGIHVIGWRVLRDLMRG